MITKHDFLVSTNGPRTVYIRFVQLSLAQHKKDMHWELTCIYELSNGYCKCVSDQMFPKQNSLNTNKVK